MMTRQKSALSLGVAAITALSCAHASTMDSSWSYMLGEQNPYPQPEAQMVEQITSAPEGYEFVAMTGFTRHGSRYSLDPDHLPELLKTFIELTAKGQLTGKGEQFLERVVAFSDWWTNNTDRLGYLTDLGFTEQETIGRRAVQMTGLENEEGGIGKPVSVTLKSSGRVRTIESASAFLFGAMKEAARTTQPVFVTNLDSIPEQQSTRQPGLREHRQKVAPIKARHMAENDARKPASVDDFISQYVTELKQEDAITLANTFFELCQQDAPQGGIRGMCTPFEDWSLEQNNQDLLDWFFTRNQLDKFYSLGSATAYQEANSIKGNFFINEFVEELEGAIQNPQTTSDIYYRFDHDAGVSSLLAVIGLMKNDGTDAERLQDFIPYQQFPMSSNISWQLYRNGNDYQVRMLHNEAPASFPIAGCEDKELCSWDIVKNHFTQPEFRSAFAESLRDNNPS